MNDVKEWVGMIPEFSRISIGSHPGISERVGTGPVRCSHRYLASRVLPTPTTFAIDVPVSRPRASSLPSDNKRIETPVRAFCGANDMFWDSLCVRFQKVTHHDQLPWVCRAVGEAIAIETAI